MNLMWVVSHGNETTWVWTNTVTYLCGRVEGYGVNGILPGYGVYTTQLHVEHKED